MTVGTSRVFISHSAKDRAKVDPILTLFRQSGIETWIAPDDVSLGKDYSIESDAAIESCTAFAVFLSAHSNKSRHVRAETQLAFTTNKRIYPVRLDGTPLAPGLRLFLGMQHWTDAHGSEREQNLRRLIAELTSTSGDSPEHTEPAPKPGPFPKVLVVAALTGLIVVSALVFAILRSVAPGAEAAPPTNTSISANVAVSSPSPSPRPAENEAPPADSPSPASRQTAIDLLRGNWDLVAGADAESLEESSCATPDWFEIESSGNLVHHFRRPNNPVPVPACIVDRGYDIIATKGIGCEGGETLADASEFYRFSDDGTMLYVSNGYTYRRCLER